MHAVLDVPLLPNTVALQGLYEISIESLVCRNWLQFGVEAAPSDAHYQLSLCAPLFGQYATRAKSITIRSVDSELEFTGPQCPSLLVGGPLVGSLGHTAISCTLVSLEVLATPS